jgi:hydrogenase maturation protein HypF
MIYRSAQSKGIRGEVRNSGYGVEILASGSVDQLRLFKQDVERFLSVSSPQASIKQTDYHFAKLPSQFEIGHSSSDDRLSPYLPVDLAPCDACHREFHDPAARRYQYWFTACTDCGPRYSLMHRAPFDRINSSYSDFELCVDCAAEYGDPDDRRFHAQFISCKICGPQLQLHIDGRQIEADPNLTLLCERINEGGIALIKTFGGYQYICRADHDEALSRLRQIKNRPHKSFGLMFHSIKQIRDHCQLTELQSEFLLKKSRPLLVIDRLSNKASNPMSHLVAPGLKTYAVMLPSNFVFEILAAGCPAPLVVTSANLQSDPIAFDDHKALSALAPHTDITLSHNLEIINPIDDSVFSSSAAGMFPVRLGRGFAPVNLDCSYLMKDSSQATSFGAFDKITVGSLTGGDIMISPHFGDSQNAEVAERIRAYSERFYPKSRIMLSVVDAHPDASDENLFDNRMRDSPTKIFHHRAHAAAALLDINLRSPAMIATLDGTGFARDYSSWGGDFWIFDGNRRFERVACLRALELIGGDAATRDIARIAFALVHRSVNASMTSMICGLMGLDTGLREVLAKMSDGSFNISHSHAMGRLYDGVAAMLGCTRQPTYDGQAAMELEALVDESDLSSYRFEIQRTSPVMLIDWQPVIQNICDDIVKDIPVQVIASKFHRSIARLCGEICEIFGLNTLAICGGVAQNRKLIELIQADQRIDLVLMRRLPPNDASISAGQLVADHLEWLDHSRTRGA